MRIIIKFFVLISLIALITSCYAQKLKKNGNESKGSVIKSIIDEIVEEEIDLNRKVQQKKTNYVQPTQLPRIPQNRNEYIDYPYDNNIKNNYEEIRNPVKPNLISYQGNWGDNSPNVINCGIIPQEEQQYDDDYVQEEPIYNRQPVIANQYVDRCKRSKAKNVLPPKTVQGTFDKLDFENVVARSNANDKLETWHCIVPPELAVFLVIICVIVAILFGVLT